MTRKIGNQSGGFTESLVRRFAGTRSLKSCRAAHRRGVVLQLESLENRAMMAGDLSAAMQPSPRIVGGHPSDQDWGWMVSLQTPTGFHFCGGSLIAPDVVLTAAHCVDDRGPSDVRVVAGITSLSDGTGERLRVGDIMIHPDWDPGRIDSDVALLFLTEATQQATISLLAPAQADLAAPGETATVIGWGQMGNGSSPDRLQQVSLPIVSNEVANDGYGPGAVTDNMLAAGLLEGGVDSCYGDSGGPLMVQDADGRYLQAGIVSWGSGCAEPNKPGIYARVTRFEEWITDRALPRSQGTLAFGQDTFFAGDEVRLALSDADLAGVGAVSVALTTADGDQEQLVLNETSPGRFSGTIQVVEGQEIADNGQLELTGTTTSLVATYIDQNDGTGNAREVSATASLRSDDHGNSTSNATLLSEGQPTMGWLESEGDSDYFAIHAEAGQRIVVDVFLHGLGDSVLTLWGPQGNYLSSNDDWAGSLRSHVEWTVTESGTYYAHVEGYSSSDVGEYRIEYAIADGTNPGPGDENPSDDHGGSLNEATSLLDGQTISGVLEVNNDYDYFAIEAVAGQTLTLDVFLNGLEDSVLVLYDANGRYLDSNDDFGGSLRSHLEWDVTQSGVYYAEVHGYSSFHTGAYEIRLETSSTPPVSTPLALGQPLVVEMAAGESRWFEFPADPGRAYEIGAFTWVPGNATVRLHDQQRVLMAEVSAGDGSTSTNPITFFNTSATSYLVELVADTAGTLALAVDVPAGDANLDGRFDSSDLIALFERGGFEDGIEDNAGWEDGDWNGDGDFTTADLVLALVRGGYNQDAGVMPAFAHWGRTTLGEPDLTGNPSSDTASGQAAFDQLAADDVWASFA